MTDPIAEGVKLEDAIVILREGLRSDRPLTLKERLLIGKIIDERAALTAAGELVGERPNYAQAINDAETSLTERCNMAWNGRGHLGDARDVSRTIWGTFKRLRDDLGLPPYQRPALLDAESPAAPASPVGEDVVERVARAICRENCAFVGEKPCFEVEGAWPNPNCQEPGCHSQARAALAAINGENEHGK